jgi:MFS family permease
VSEEHLPAAISLGSISYNVARSFGPALGGVVVLAAGAKAAFGINAVFYLPLWVAFFFWQRRHTPSRLPPERIDRAIVSGARFALHSSPIRTVLLRTLLFSLASASYSALGPLIARDILHGTAATYGLMLGATGIGAVIGAVYLSEMKRHASSDVLVRIFALITGASLVVLAWSHSLLLSATAFFFIGIANMQTASLFNIGVQLTSPRWVTARALSLYSSAMTGGIAVGAIIWGHIAARHGVSVALAISGGAAGLTALAGTFLPLPREEEIDIGAVELGNEPEVAMALTMRSGPVVVEVEYEVTLANARAFYGVALRMQGVRHRNGGFSWSIARDIADPSIWTERYHCPTWGDYLRMRSRYTQSDLEVLHAVDGFCEGGQSRRVRRWLERPFGSVRWKADSPDPQVTVGYIGP